LDRRKGQDRLIRAMPAILERIPAAVLLIAGSGPEESRLRAMVDELRLQSSVLFLGHVSDEDRLAWYRTADLYAMPNRTLNDGDTEGFGLVFLEAGACGLGVIGGRAGGVPDAILDGETGLLVDGESVPDIAAACIRLLLDPQLRATMGRNGMAHAARMSWPIQAAAFLRICDSLADSPRPSPIVAEAALK
jgi:phosphatidylinositol alpha-1,6-mannosyltransferase